MARAISVDELFAEPFEPEWMAHDRRIALQIWEYNLKYNADYRFRNEATTSRLRIASRCDDRGNYSNTPKTPATATGVRTRGTRRTQIKTNSKGKTRPSSA